MLPGIRALLLTSTVLVSLLATAPLHGRGAQAPSPAVAPAASKPSRDWKQLQAPGLLVVGNAHGTDLRRTAESIVRFRLAMRSLLPFIRTDPPAPTTAVVFRDDNALTPFKPRSRGKPIDMVAAYFEAQPDVNYIVMAMGEREFTHQTVFHEYTHLLVDQNIKRLPLWLNEGLADFFSTFDGSEQDGRLIIGRPLDYRVAMLVGQYGPFPMSQFIEPNGIPNLYGDGLATARFYAQSWALVHYLMLGDNGTHRPQLGAFMAGLQNGDPAPEVFKRIFGEDLTTLDHALIRYVSLMKLPAIQVTPPEVAIDGDATPMREIDAERLQGDLMVRTGAFDEADRHLDKATAIDRMDVATRLSRARSLIAQDHAGEAIDLLSAPDLIAQPDLPTVFLRAEANRYARHYDVALTDYRAAIALRPDFAFAYYGLSLAQLGLNLPEAAPTFSRVFLLKPGAGWYYSRLQDSQRMGIDKFAVADAINFVQQAGWKDTGSPYTMYIAALSYDRRKLPEKATEILTDVLAHVEASSWQAAVASFLEGKLGVSGLLSKASSPGLQTEAHAYIGIKAHIDGDTAAARQHLQWVKDKGLRSYTEYGLTLGELDRIEREK